MGKATDVTRRGLPVLRSFIGAVSSKIEGFEFGIDIGSEKGAGDSGDREADLTPRSFYNGASCTPVRTWRTHSSSTYTMMRWCPHIDNPGLLMALLADYQRLRDSGVAPEAILEIARKDAARLAGGPGDLVQHAIAYHYLYRHSGGNFVFPLLAAHGALWARWYLIAGRTVAEVLSIADFANGGSRSSRLAAYAQFVDALKSINRQVLIETFALVHCLPILGRHPLITAGMPEPLLSQLLDALEKGRTGAWLADAELKSLYESYFRWQQSRIVAPAIAQALTAFDWPLMRRLCLRPRVWFTYFRPGRSLDFLDFADAQERSQKALAAFELASEKGLDAVEVNLLRNPLLPRAFTKDPAAYFDQLVRHLINHGSAT